MDQPQLWLLQWLPHQICSSSFRSAWFCLATTDHEGDNKGCCWSCHCATAVTSVLDDFSGLCHGSSSGEFSFSELSLQPISLWWSWLWCLHSAFRFFSNEGSTTGVSPPQPFGVYPWEAYVSPGTGPWLTPGVYWVAASSTASSRGASCYWVSCLFTIQSIWLSMQLWSLAESHLIPVPSLYGRDGSSFQGFFHLMTWLLWICGGTTLNHSSLVIGYQVDESTCTWLQNILLLNHTFTLSSWEVCQH